MSYTLEIGKFVTVPLKKSSDIDLVKPIETFARNTFDKVDDDLKKHVKEFNALRKNAVCKTQDKTQSSLNILLQYYDQFSSLNRKVPFRENGGVNICFSWKNALDKGSLFSGSSKLSLPSGEFERLCLLYNIAALKGQMAGDLNFNTDDGLKSAAMLFVESAGMFQYVKDHVMSVTNQAPTQDLGVEVLNSFKCIMVAQAQECFYEKASAAKMKPDLLAKVANQACSLYGDAVKAVSEANNILPKEVSTACSLRQDKFQCLAQYHQAAVAHNEKKFGEEIARLKKVEPMLKALSKSNDLLSGFDAKDFMNRASVQLQESEKENNFIYHDTIPKESQLAAIGKADIAKPKPFNSNVVLSAKFTDAFASLVPLTVHNALQSYETRRKEIVDKEVGRLREQTTLLNGVMSSLNLPAALEDASGGDQLPPSILEKSQFLIELLNQHMNCDHQAVLSLGGISAIEGLLRDLPESLFRNEQILNESKRMLDEEQTSDTELRQKFGDKWKRTPSSELTGPLRQEAAKYSMIIENAQKADGIIREKYGSHKQGIEMLCMTSDKLKSAIPSASKIAALKDNPVVVELRNLCEQAETVKAEREVIETELKGAKSEMTDKFTQALASEGALNEESISVEELDRVYQPLILQVTESGHRQESLLANIQRASEQFTVLKAQGAGGNNRDEILKTIAAAHDGYQELMSNLQEGKKFYNDLTQLLLKLQGKCSDLVFARKTEKEEIMKDMQQTIVSQPPTESSAPPSYHQQARQAPARPPPPNPPAASVPTASDSNRPPIAAPRKPRSPAPNPVPATAASSVTPAAAPAPNLTQPGYPMQGYGYQPMPGYGAYQQPGYAPYPGAPPPGAPPYGYQMPTAPGYAPQQPGYPGAGMAPYPPQPGPYSGYPSQQGQQPPQNYGNYPHNQPPYYQQYPQ